MAQSVDRQSTPNALVRAYPWLALLAAIVILIQAFFAGRFLFAGDDLLDVHGRVGELTFLLTIVLLVSAWLGRPSGRSTNLELGLSAALLVLAVAQLVMGYSDDPDATATHVANGVLLMGLAATLTTLAFRRRAAQP